PNGAGKTTLFDVITGRVVPDSGSVRVAGVELLGRPSHQLTRLGIARTFQECRIFPDKTCLENVLFAAEDKRLGGVLRRMVTGDPGVRRTHRDDAMRLLALVNLDLYAERPAAALSFGQKRLLE